MEELPERCWEAEVCCLLPSWCEGHDGRDESEGILASLWSRCGSSPLEIPSVDTNDSKPLSCSNMYQKTVQQRMGWQLGQQKGGWVVFWACKRKQRLGPNCVIRQIYKLH